MWQPVPVHPGQLHGAHFLCRVLVLLFSFDASEKDILKEKMVDMEEGMDSLRQMAYFHAANQNKDAISKVAIDFNVVTEV